MKLGNIVNWLDKELNVAAFSDVSNNGVQVARTATEAKTVAFAVDASVRAVEAAAKAGANQFVAGSYLFKQADMKAAVAGMREKLK